MLGQQTSQRSQQAACSLHSAYGPARAGPAAGLQPPTLAGAPCAAPLTGRQQPAQQLRQGRKSLRVRASKAGELAYEDLKSVAEEACRRGEQVLYRRACLCAHGRARIH